MKTSQLFSKNITNINLLRIFALTLLTTLLTFFISQEALALTPPTLLSPANNAEINSTSCTFSWSHPYNDQYELKIKTQAGTLRYASGKISSKSITVDLSSIPLTYGSTYKWYVVVYANGQQDSSADSYFTYKPNGYCSVSGGVSISPNPVTLDQNFNISFTLKEVRGFPKTFENVAIAILRSDNSYVFDFAMYGSVTVSANGTWSQTATNYLYATNPPGTYKAIIRGKVGGAWFDFDTTSSGVNPMQFTAVNPSGYCSVSGGVSISPNPVVLGHNFNISFTLKEVRGFPKTFENVAIAILDSNNNYVFDFAMYGSVTVPANGTWSQTATNYLYATNPPGTYKAIIRGKIGGAWFDFDTTGSGVNPCLFTAQDGYCSVSGGVSIPSSVVLSQNFSISFTLKEVRGAAKTFENVAIAILDSNDNYVFDFAMYSNVTVAANGTWSQTATNYLYVTNPPGPYKAMVRGKVGGVWFNFDTTGSGVNPGLFTATAPVQPSGYCSVSGGVSVDPDPVVLGHNFSISFTLQEIRGFPKTFENVAIAILDSDNNYVFDFAMYSNVTVTANGTWSQTATNYLYNTRPSGIYKAILRGKVGGTWFDFDTIGSGVNPRQFKAVTLYALCIGLKKDVTLLDMTLLEGFYRADFGAKLMSEKFARLTNQKKCYIINRRYFYWWNNKE